jgi:hypothetical protein
LACSAQLGSGLLDSAWFGSIWFSLAWFCLVWLGVLGLAQLTGLSQLGSGLVAQTRRGHPIDDALGAIVSSSIVVMHCLSRSAEADSTFGG